jgi:hypothetical protein
LNTAQWFRKANIEYLLGHAATSDFERNPQYKTRQNLDPRISSGQAQFEREASANLPRKGLVDESSTSPRRRRIKERTTAPCPASVLAICRRIFSSLCAVVPILKIVLLSRAFTVASALPINDTPANFDTIGTGTQVGFNANATEDVAWIFLQWLLLLISFISILRHDTTASRIIADIEVGAVQRRAETKTGSLLLFTSAGAVGTFALGYEGTLSNLALSGYWAFSGGLIWEYGRRKLLSLEKTAGPTALVFAVLDISITGTIVALRSPSEGRYSDPVVFYLCTALPVAMVLEWAYVACVLNWGFAQRLENAASKYLEGPQLSAIQAARSRLRDVRSNSRGRPERRGGYS